MKHTLLATTLLLIPAASHAASYSLDDGVISGGLSIGGGTVGLLVNKFQSVPDSENISSLDISFGPISGQMPSAFSIILFSDPNGDGNLHDGIELARADAIKPGDTIANQFYTFHFNSPVFISAGSNFFAGVLEPAIHPGLEVGTDALGGTSSWAVVGSEDPSSASSINTLPVFGFSTDLMIRANSVPEPSSAALLAFASLSLCLRRRKA